MLREAEPVVELPPCTVCRQPGEVCFWGATICRGCHATWMREHTPLDTLELAHADAHPEDVQQRGEYQMKLAGRVDHRWALLKGDISTRLAREGAEAWLRAARAKASKSRAA